MAWQQVESYSFGFSPITKKFWLYYSLKGASGRKQVLPHPHTVGTVAAEVILTHCAEVKVTHLGEDDGFFGAVDVDPGAGSGDTSDGPKG